MAHDVLRGRAERVAIADRQALLTAAAVNGAQDYTPVDVQQRLDDWEASLMQDPTAPVAAGESFADRVARYQEQVAELDKLTEVA